MPLFLPGPGPWVNPSTEPQFFPPVAPTVDLDATAGDATATGSGSALTFTLAASAGAAAATGGTVNTTETVTAASGTATAAGGTAALTFTLTTAAGAAAASGGDATASVAVPPVAYLFGRGLTAGVIRTVPAPASLYRLTPHSAVLGGLTVSTGTLNLTADTGTSTAAGGTSSLTVTLAASAGTAAASGGTATITGALTAASGTATAGGGTIALTVVLAATGGTAAAGGGDATVGPVIQAVASVYGRGLTTGVVRAVTTPAPLYRLVRRSQNTEGLAPALDLNLAADTGPRPRAAGTPQSVSALLGSRRARSRRAERSESSARRAPRARGRPAGPGRARTR